MKPKPKTIEQRVCKLEETQKKLLRDIKVIRHNTDYGNGAWVAMYRGLIDNISYAFKEHPKKAWLVLFTGSIFVAPVLVALLKFYHHHLTKLLG